jgi:5-methylcytosine-specific restriction endonuclease McrA
VTEPYPKTKQLARGERRYRRKVASPKQWQAIIAGKRGPCRACDVPALLIEYHHLIPRSQGGDDVAENIVPLHAYCHEKVTRGRKRYLDRLAESLTDAEYAYVVGKLGEGALERLFGVGR